MPIHAACKAWIATLIAKDGSITILVEYTDFANIFVKKSATILLKYTKINIYAINLEESK